MELFVRNQKISFLNPIEISCDEYLYFARGILGLSWNVCCPHMKSEDIQEFPHSSDVSQTERLTINNFYNDMNSFIIGTM